MADKASQLLPHQAKKHPTQSQQRLFTARYLNSHTKKLETTPKATVCSVGSPASLRNASGFCLKHFFLYFLKCLFPRRVAKSPINQYLKPSNSFYGKNLENAQPQKRHGQKMMHPAVPTSNVYTLRVIRWDCPQFTHPGLPEANQAHSRESQLTSVQLSEVIQDDAHVKARLVLAGQPV